MPFGSMIGSKRGSSTISFLFLTNRLPYKTQKYDVSIFEPIMLEKDALRISHWITELARF